MQTPTIEQRIAEIAREAGLSYMCETWPRANLRFDKYRRDRDGVVKADDGSTLPALLYVQPVSGGLVFTSTGFLKDSPQTLLAFADAMPLDFTGEQAQTIGTSTIDSLDERSRVISIEIETTSSFPALYKLEEVVRIVPVSFVTTV